MTQEQETGLKEEFESFNPPRKFRGGCKRSRKYPSLCVHLTYHGDIGQIQEGCPNLSSCRGLNFKYNI